MRNCQKKSLKIRHLEVCLQVTSEAFDTLKKYHIFFKNFSSHLDCAIRMKKGSWWEPFLSGVDWRINHQTFSV